MKEAKPNKTKQTLQKEIQFQEMFLNAYDFVDFFSGTIKLLLHSLLQKINTKFQVEVFFFQISDLLWKKKENEKKEKKEKS